MHLLKTLITMVIIYIHRMLLGKVHEKSVKKKYFFFKGTISPSYLNTVFNNQDVV